MRCTIVWNQDGDRHILPSPITSILMSCGPFVDASGSFRMDQSRL